MDILWLLGGIVFLILIGFISDMNKTKRFLRQNPLKDYIGSILETVNNAVFDGEAELREVSYKRVFLWRRHDSIYIDFWMGAGILFVEIHYRFFGADNKVVLKYHKAHELTDEQKQFIAREIVYTARQIRARQLAATAAVWDVD